jgi:hypothetical protein
MLLEGFGNPQIVNFPVGNPRGGCQLPDLVHERGLRLNIHNTPAGMGSNLLNDVNSLRR